MQNHRISVRHATPRLRWCLTAALCLAVAGCGTTPPPEPKGERIPINFPVFETTTKNSAVPITNQNESGNQVVIHRIDEEHVVPQELLDLRKAEEAKIPQDSMPAAPLKMEKTEPAKPVQATPPSSEPSAAKPDLSAKIDRNTKREPVRTAETSEKTGGSSPLPFQGELKSVPAKDETDARSPSVAVPASKIEPAKPSVSKTDTALPLVKNEAQKTDAAEADKPEFQPVKASDEKPAAEPVEKLDQTVEAAAERLQDVKTEAEETAAEVKESAEDAVKAAQTSVAEAADKVAEQAAETADAVKEEAADAVEAAKQTADSVVEQAKDAANDAAKSVEAVVDDVQKDAEAVKDVPVEEPAVEVKTESTAAGEEPGEAAESPANAVPSEQPMSVPNGEADQTTPPVQTEQTAQPEPPAEAVQPSQPDQPALSSVSSPTQETEVPAASEASTDGAEFQPVKTDAQPKPEAR